MKTFSAEGIVLKRSNYGEADRIVTVYTREYGKLVGIAKGVRKVTSTKKSALEPGDRSKLFFSRGHGMPLITQAILIHNMPDAQRSLRSIRNLSQVLEIVDVLTVEEQGQEDVYDTVQILLENLEDSKPGMVKEIQRLLHTVLEMLGFDEQDSQTKRTITNMVEELSNRKLKSFSYLSVS